MSYYYNDYSGESDDILAGDIVRVRHGRINEEGLVIGRRIDHLGRLVIEVQLDAEVYQVFSPHVTRVRRTISYSRAGVSAPNKVRTIERRILW